MFDVPNLLIVRSEVEVTALCRTEPGLAIRLYTIQCTGTIHPLHSTLHRHDTLTFSRHDKIFP